MARIIPRILILLIVLIGMVQVTRAQQQWTPPVLIDTSGDTFYSGGEMAIDDSGNIYTTFHRFDSSYISIARSSDNGETWIKYAYSGGGETVKIPQGIAVDHHGNVWLLWISSQGGDFSPYYVNLSKSIDSGRTFAAMFRSRAWGNGFFFEKLAVDAQNSIYMLWDDQQFKVTRFRYGDIMQRVDAEIPNDTLQFDSYTALGVSRDFVVQCVWNGVFYDSAHDLHEYVFYSRATDTGMTSLGRTRVDTIEGYQDFPTLAMDTTGRIFVSYTKSLAFGTPEIRVAKSTNGGQSFDRPLIISGADTVYNSVLCIDSKNGVNVLWNWQGQGIRHYRSSDGGDSFSPFAFPRIGFYDFKAGKNGSLYATTPTDSGFGFAKTNVILSVSEHLRNPNIFALFPNYPNPFNSSTMIRFSADKTEKIELKIYDIIGREVGVLISKRLAPGTYSATWNAEHFNSGAYFVRLIAGENFVATTKMILIR